MFNSENIKKIIGKRSRVYFYSLCLLLFSFSSYAQCAMCRAALSGDENKAKAAGVNDGIVYLMAIPYVLVGLLGYYIYKTRKKKA